jgi:hypothetical protein
MGRERIMNAVGGGGAAADIMGRRMNKREQ